MNYSSFCEYLLAALTNQMEHGVTISKESIRKNNNVYDTCQYDNIHNE